MRIARIVLGLSLLLMAVNAFGQKVTTDSVPGTDWSKYHTYSWGEGTPAQDPLVAQRIVAGIDAQLAAKGLKKVESDPDLLVMYHAATDQQNLSTGKIMVAGDALAVWVQRKSIPLLPDNLKSTSLISRRSSFSGGVQRQGPLAQIHRRTPNSSIRL